jgi:signal peptidase I
LLQEKGLYKLEAAYEPPSSETGSLSSRKPRSVVVTILLSLVVGPSIAMLYLARPIRFAIYTAIIVYSAIYKPLLGIEFLGETDLLDSFSYVIIALIGTVDAVVICKSIPNDQKMPLYSRWYVIVPTIFILTFSLFFFRILLIEHFSIPSHSMNPNYVPGDMIYVDKRKSSMLTTHGEILHRFKNEKSVELVKRGNVVLYLPNEKQELFPGRIIGLPGEKIEFIGHHFQLSRCNEEGCVDIESQFTDLNSEYLMMGGIKDRAPIMGRLFQETVEEVSYKVIHAYDSFRKTNNFLEQNTVLIPKGHVFIMGDNRDNSLDNRFTGSVPIENIAGEVL